ncbi:GlpM protein [Pectobacterium versatile]|nr:GlpM protein [Pectobacterium versatile]
MSLFIKSVIGALIVLLISVLAKSRNYYIAGLVPLFPTFRADRTLHRWHRTWTGSATRHHPVWHLVRYSLSGLSHFTLLLYRVDEIATGTARSGRVLEYISGTVGENLDMVSGELGVGRRGGPPCHRQVISGESKAFIFPSHDSPDHNFYRATELCQL